MFSENSKLQLLIHCIQAINGDHSCDEFLLEKNIEPELYHYTNENSLTLKVNGTLNFLKDLKGAAFISEDRYNQLAKQAASLSSSNTSNLRTPLLNQIF